jgi:D-alanine-D-alanine ligase-like ATP-grasp enzyme
MIYRVFFQVTNAEPHEVAQHASLFNARGTALKVMAAMQRFGLDGRVLVKDSRSVSVIGFEIRSEK